MSTDYSNDRARISRVSTEYGDVALDERRGKYWHLNESAALALNLIEEDTPHEHVVDKFVEVYEIDRERANRDIASLRQSLTQSGLL